MSRNQLSVETLADIYSAWCQALPPTQVAKALRIKLSTVIAEYVQLDDQLTHYSVTNSTNFSNRNKETSHG
jgi:hypothetical protein